MREGCALLQGHRHLWALRAAAAGLLQRQQRHSRLLLPGQQHRQRPGPALPARRRRSNRRGGGRPSSRPSPLPASRPRLAAEQSKPSTMRRWRSGDCKSSGPAMRPNGPSGVTAGRAREPARGPRLESRMGAAAATTSPRPRPSLPDASTAARATQPRSATALAVLGDGLERVWDAPTTTDRDRKELLRTLLEEVNIAVEPDQRQGHLTLRWRGGLVTETRRRGCRTPEPPRSAPMRTRSNWCGAWPCITPTATIAGILNRQGRKTATGFASRPTASATCVGHWKIPRSSQPPTPTKGNWSRQEGGADPRRRALHHPPLAQRRLHRRRADHSRRALAHPHDRRAQSRASSKRLQTATSR